MPLSDHARWRVVLRTVGTVVAIASAGVAIWLIARGGDSRTVQIGVIVGLWAALLGSATLFGTRRTGVAGEGLRPGDLDRVVEASAQAARGVAQQAANQAAERAADRAVQQVAGQVTADAADAAVTRAVAAVQEANAGRELERRRTAEVERERDEATRREFALSLELMLRREMERTLREELDALRQEVAGLRNDLTEKVPGQIRLERIETTRLIGSDLEALQVEVRRLAEERVALGGGSDRAATAARTVVDATPVPAAAASAPPVGESDERRASVRPAAAADASGAHGVNGAAPDHADGSDHPAGTSAHRTDRLRPVPDDADWSSPTVSSAGSRHGADAVPDSTADAVVAAAPSTDAAPPALRVDPAPTPVAVPERAVDDSRRASDTAPDPASTAEPAASAGPIREVDPFAGLPRLSRWVDPFDDDDAPPAAPAPPAAAGPSETPDDPSRGHVAAADHAADAADAARYVGRRRQPGDEVDPTPAPAEPTGRRRRRADDDAGSQPEETTAERAGGRRRRRDDDPPTGGHARDSGLSDDVLSRLLGR